ncbi:hypothetical protein B0H10DRAFT_1948453 [Mycena sp. CBHHK59/15]|nr:hypothetical protein B0H10DRAFT_1948453 [Mycena sp. CBHHK59/15]
MPHAPPPAEIIRSRIKALFSPPALSIMNADMDGVQAMGIGRSVMKHNDPEYNVIPNDTPPEKIAPRFIRICWRHSKEPVHDFKSLVSAADHARLLDFVYIDSKVDVPPPAAMCCDLARDRGAATRNVRKGSGGGSRMRERVCMCSLAARDSTPRVEAGGWTRVLSARTQLKTAKALGGGY